MNIEPYDNIGISTDFKLCSVVSQGPKGSLRKIVKFSAFKQIPGSYNMALATAYDEIVDYSETTNNNDRDKIPRLYFTLPGFLMMLTPLFVFKLRTNMHADLVYTDCIITNNIITNNSKVVNPSKSLALVPFVAHVRRHGGGVPHLARSS